MAKGQSRRSFCLFCIIVFLVLTFLLPSARMVTDAHYHLGVVIRSQRSINQFLADGLRSVFRSIDQYGTNSTAVQPLSTALYKKLVASRSYLELAKESLRGLHQLHPVSNHNAWYHGMSDAWAFWALIIMSCSVLMCDDLPYDLESNNIRAVLAWRGLSGSSDDILWGTLAMLGASRRFLNLDYLANGARGPILLYSEVQDRFAVRSGNSTSMYWDTVKAYQATISITLWVTASCELHKQTGEYRYVENAMSAYRALEQLGLIDHGQIYDGVHTDTGNTTNVQKTKWSYNNGMALGALTGLYMSTNDTQYLILGKEVAETGVADFWPDDGHLKELATQGLAQDQWSFKGIFLHYLAKFLEVAGSAGRLDMAWVRKLKAKCEAESTWLVENRLNATGGFCVYWGEQDADEKYCKEEVAYPPQGMVVASQLFLMTHKLQTLGNSVRK